MLHHILSPMWLCRPFKHNFTLIHEVGATSLNFILLWPSIWLPCHLAPMSSAPWILDVESPGRPPRVHPCEKAFVSLNDDFDRNLHQILYTWIVVHLCNLVCIFKYCQISDHCFTQFTAKCSVGAQVSLSIIISASHTSHIKGRSAIWICMYFFSFFSKKILHLMLHIYTSFHPCGWWNI